MPPIPAKAYAQLFRRGIIVVLAVVLAEPLLADGIDDAIRLSMSQQVAPLLDREVLMRGSQIGEVRVSLDNKSIAYRIRREKFSQLWLYDIATEQHRLIFSTELLDNLFWSKDSKYLFTVSEQGVAVVPLSDTAAPWFVINLDPNEEQHLVGPDYTQDHAFIVSVFNKKADEYELIRVQADGLQEKLYSSKSRLRNPVLDEYGELSFFKRVIDTRVEVIRLVDGHEQVFLHCPSPNFDICRLQSYRRDTETLHMLARFESDLTGLYALNTRTRETTLLHSDPKREVDLESVRFDPQGNPVMVAYFDDYTSLYGLSSEAEQAISVISDEIDSVNLSILPVGQRWLVIDFDLGRVANRYFLYDITTQELSRPLQSVAESLSAEKPLINDRHIAIRIPVHYAVSDNMRQVGYLTLPRGMDPSGIPLIVNPHGGPRGRDKGIYDDLSQLLVNRGYAVFQPNFRASSGFGQHYMISSNHDFGDGRVQQDIIDGMEYILSRGIGDRDKLAIVGGSFGGFSTLNGLTFTPDLFKLGVAVAPTIDLVKTIKTFAADKALSENLPAMIEFFFDADDPEALSKMRDKSPDTHAGRVSKPLYIWAGRQDKRVSILHVRDYALRQREAGKAVMLLEDAGSGHGPTEALAVEAYFYLYEKALADHLGGRLQQSMSPRLARFLKRSVVIDQNNFLPDSLL